MTVAGKELAGKGARVLSCANGEAGEVEVTMANMEAKLKTRCRVWRGERHGGGRKGERKRVGEDPHPA